MLRMSKFRQMEKGHAKEKMKCVGNFESGRHGAARGASGE